MMGKEVVKNYILKLNTLIVKWVMFCDEPVITPLQCQVVFQYFIKHCMLVLEISGKSFGKAFGRTTAMLSKPEGMFKTDEDSYKSI